MPSLIGLIGDSAFFKGPNTTYKVRLQGLMAHTITEVKRVEAVRSCNLWKS